MFRHKHWTYIQCYWMILYAIQYHGFHSAMHTFMKFISINCHLSHLSHAISISLNEQNPKIRARIVSFASLTKTLWFRLLVLSYMQYFTAQLAYRKPRLKNEQLFYGDSTFYEEKLAATINKEHL